MSPRSQKIVTAFAAYVTRAKTLTKMCFGLNRRGSVIHTTALAPMLAAGDTCSFASTLLPSAAIAFALLVPVLVNPVHALLSLLGLFATTVLLYIALGAEYLGLVFLIVYVGALAILFLFVIMLLNVNDIMAATKIKLSPAYKKFSVLFVAGFTSYTLNVTQTGLCAILPGLDTMSRSSETATARLAHFVSTDILHLRSLYTLEHGALFMLITGILLIAMLGAIIAAKSSQSTSS